MRKKFVFLFYRLLALMRKRCNKPDEVRKYITKSIRIKGKVIQSAQSINRIMYNYIRSGAPFFVGRFGATELFAVRTFDFEIKSRYQKCLEQMRMWSGFFPPDQVLGKRFKDLMIESMIEADVMGIWLQPFEEYYLNKYGNSNLVTTYLRDLEPWSAPENPWSAALEGKKVLVIHPFAETIQKQYQKREKLFPGTNILPEFELKTLKAVQTIAGEKDERFKTWFDALDWMYQEAMKIDFDIAIIGCGAYGYPLAAKLKQAGKQAVHLGGITQVLFGIKGKRWEEEPGYAYVRKFFNENWVYPSQQDRPKQADKVEDACYW